MSIPSISDYDAKTGMRRRRRGPSEQSGCCVYFVRNTENDLACKVGWSTSLEKRIASLERETRMGIIKHTVIYCRNNSTARAIEGDIHRRLKDRGLWLAGEWFRLEDAEIAAIAEETAGRNRNASLTKGGFKVLDEAPKG